MFVEDSINRKSLRRSFEIDEECGQPLNNSLDIRVCDPSSYTYISF